MQEPNFFILGAPKCGTTSLASWLGGHPSVFMAPFKEPHYYATDLRNRQIDTERDYLKLFRGAGKGHQAVGEASVWYLYSAAAMPNLLADHPEARCIVCLRNPVDMAPSLHDQHLRAGNEDRTDFAEAWALQAQRARGEAVPRKCSDPQLLLYGSACALGSQLERLYAAVPAERVMPILLGDLKADPGAVYRDVLAFLGTADDGRTEFPARNPAGVRRSLWLQQGVQGLARLRRALGLPRPGTGLSQAVNRLNQKPRPAAPLDPGMRAELVGHFTPEIERMEAQLGRDLGAWKR